jgi:4-hydroxy-tetrahydrodipicolinate synthase
VSHAGVLQGQLMLWDEHIMLISHTVNRFGAQLAVVGNTGSNSTREALHATEQGFAVGMHAALQINPYYGKTSAAGLRTHFHAVLQEGPAILYNVPGRCLPRARTQCTSVAGIHACN